MNLICVAYRILLSLLVLGGLTIVVSSNFNDHVVSVNNPAGLNNETLVEAEKYFRNLLKKATHGESVEDHSFKIIDNANDLKAAFCNLYNKHNDTEGSLDRREKRLISEMRKLNMKLMKIEENLGEIEKNLGALVKAEMKALKDELRRNVQVG